MKVDFSPLRLLTHGIFLIYPTTVHVQIYNGPNAMDNLYISFRILLTSRPPFGSFLKLWC